MREEYRGKNITVVGAGLSGRGLSAFFLECGARVVLSDRRRPAEIKGLDPLREGGLLLDLGGHSPEYFDKADLIVVSPGVPLTIPEIECAVKKGVPVVGEVEVAFKELQAPVAAITGTNGKSTTTTLMGEIFRAWGKKTFVGGNLGTPLLEATKEVGLDWVVAELSSFQLESICSFRPRYALLLNITEDHLDRYPGMDEYVAAKGRIFENMGPGDIAVLNDDDPRVLALARDLSFRKIAFSSSRLLPEGMGYENGELVWRFEGTEKRFPASEMKLKGLHNIENAMAALVPPLLEGCPADVAWEAVCAFRGLPHRMEVVRTLDGATWYNDSKGTNVGSVVKSLGGLEYPVTLIAGGKDKGGDYSPLAELVREKVATLILLGQAAPRIRESIGHLTETVTVGSIDEAVQTARQRTPSGGAVLLSPGCSSFDMFTSFEERGDVFARAVLALTGKEEG